jgi:hypothetical protein
MPTIALRDEGGDSRNDYKLVFSGDEKPDFADVHGATDSPDADIYRNNQDDWVVEDHVWGGIDGWTYSGEKIRMAFDDTSRIDGQVNDRGWYPITEFESAEEFGNGGGSGQTDVPTSSDFGSFANERPGLGAVARDYSTGGNVEMHVGSGYAYPSLQAAFNDIPHHVNHEVRIYVHGRTNDPNTAHIHNVMMANDVDFIVDGSDNGVVANGGVNVDIIGKMDHIQFESLTFEFISQCVNARFEGCRFEGNGTAAFSGKNGSKMLIDCIVGSEDDDFAVFSIGGEIIELRNCELNGNTAAVRGIGASIHTFTGNNDINAPKRMEGVSDPTYIGGGRVEN